MVRVEETADRDFLALATAARAQGAVRVKHGAYEIAWDGPPASDTSPDRPLTSKQQSELERLKALAEHARELGIE